jgi:hypothetical protein
MHIKQKIKTAMDRASGILANTLSSSSVGARMLSDNSQRITTLKNKHADQRCFILGNGPSLKIEDLTRLKGEITFAHNKVFLAFDLTPWRPSYYNVEDYMVIRQNRETINALKGFPKLLNCHEPGTWTIDEWTITYRLLVSSEEAYPEFSENPYIGLTCGYSVCYSSLQWAYFMGFKSIVLLGMDFNFVVPNTDAKGEIKSDGEMNHFMPNYRQRGEVWVTPKLERQEKAFKHARDWLGKRGVRVFNATRGGKLEVFPRVNLDDVL